MKVIYLSYDGLQASVATWHSKLLKPSWQAYGGDLKLSDFMHFSSDNMNTRTKMNNAF
jgi:hypothetical protein